MDDWKDILSSNEEKLTDEDLLKYLDDHLSAEEKSYLSNKVTGSFEIDALDGLKQIKDKAALQDHLLQLNQKLPQLLRQKRHRPEQKQFKDVQWFILAIVILLLICIIGYAIITVHKISPTTY